MTVGELGIGLALLQGDPVAEIARSPFVVPVAGTVMILGISVAKIWSGVRTREMQSQERLAAMAKGLPVPPEPLPQAVLERLQEAPGARAVVRRQPGDGTNSRRAGIVLLSIGIGLMAFFVCLAAIIHVREVLIPAAVGFIPMALGVGFLIESQLRRRDTRMVEPQDEFLAQPRPVAAAFGVPAAPPPVYAPSFSMADVPRGANGEPETTTLKPYEQER